MNESGEIVHKWQQKGYTCGAACYAMLLGIEENIATKECKTTSKGTHLFKIQFALKKRGIQAHVIYPEKKDWTEMLEWFNNLSKHFPIITSGEYYHRYSKKGRDSMRRHAALIADGMIYDPSENSEIDIECYEGVFNKKLVINSLLIIEIERPSFGRQTKTK